MNMYRPQTYASRNLTLCTKDCLCLFVCPTGATDTENGQVDASKCVSGCRLCIDSCPSHALSLMYHTYPPQQEKSDEVVEALFALAKSKTEQEAIARSIAETSNNPAEVKLARAVERSSRVCAEDFYREARFMIPQSGFTHEFLELIAEEIKDEDFPREAVQKLLESIEYMD